MNLSLGINIGGRAVGGFSPALLFAASEPGVWYDPSDFSTMFQESTGVTPVTAVGQSVGFLGDKSRGFVLGSELVTNGDFSSGTTGWTAVNGNGSVVDGKYRVEQTGAAFILARTQITGLTVGRTYRVVGTFATITNASNSQIWVGTALGAQDLNFSRGSTTPATVSVYFVAGATTRQVEFVVNAAGTGIMEIDNISVRELPGNHATQSTAASRPTLGRVPVGGRRNLLTFTEQFDNAAWTKVSATVAADAGVAPDGTTTAENYIPAAGTVSPEINRSVSGLTSGAAYTYSVYLKDTGAGSGWFEITLLSPTVRSFFDIRNGVKGVGAGSIQNVGGGWYRCSVPTTLNATSSVLYVSPRSADNNSGAIVATAVPYALIWGAQLETGSTATAYQRVVTAFDVTQAGVADCYYLSFDGSDDFMLTGTITPGIDKAQVFAGVRKLSDAATGTIAETSVNSGSNAGSFGVFSAGYGGAAAAYAANLFGSQRSSFDATTYTAPITNVLTATFDTAQATRASEIGVRVDGVVPTLTGGGFADAGTGNYLAYPLYIGRRGGATLPFNGQLFSLVTRFGANLTADQITQAERFVAGKTGVVI